MIRSQSFAVIALCSVTLLAWQDSKKPEPMVRLKEERMTLEYTVNNGEAAVVFQAESEHFLGHVEVRSPLTTEVFRLEAPQGQHLALAGFKLESQEYTLNELKQRYREGVYDMRARTADGRRARGSAVFSHRLPAAPFVTYPREGETDVSPTVCLQWTPNPEAVAYQVGLEQGDSDTMRVTLPAMTSCFRVPRGVLRRGAETHVEIGAVGRNGNCTFVETTFTTR